VGCRVDNDARGVMTRGADGNGAHRVYASSINTNLWVTVRVHIVLF
jgi:hypothetical protein